MISKSMRFDFDLAQNRGLPRLRLLGGLLRLRIIALSNLTSLYVGYGLLIQKHLGDHILNYWQFEQGVSEIGRRRDN